MDGRELAETGRIPSLWQLLALADDQLERSDLVLMNLAVAREIPSLATLDPAPYSRTVDQWAQQFGRWLPGAERRFHQTPANWKNDIRFYRIGMLAGFLGSVLGLGYIPEQRHLKAVSYTDPSQLFLNGLIDTKRGTCASLPVLHAAMARRLGWPVSLACIHSHFVSRFDDGKVVYNIEATDIDRGGFAEGSDDDYLRMYKLPRKAITSGSDLRKLTAREMLGVFVAMRARHYSDTGQAAHADTDFSLARCLFPQYRWAYKRAMVHTVWRGQQLFESSEIGHPNSLVQDLAPVFAPNAFSSGGANRDLGLPVVAKLPDQVLRAHGIYTVKVPLSAVQLG